MIFSRLLARLPRVNFVAIDDLLTQVYAYRFLCGGLYVKMDGHWYGVFVLVVLDDGSRVLRFENGSPGSFHETFLGFQKLEDHS